MGDYASKGVAGTGLGLGIAGTALGLLNNNNGNGLLGGIFGGNNYETDRLRAENSMLRSEKYSDKSDIEVYKASVNAASDMLQRELKTVNAVLTPVTQEVAAIREREAATITDISALKRELEIKDAARIKEDILKEQLLNSRLENVEGKLNHKIDGVANMASNGITALNGAVACIQKTLYGITKTIVPATAICPEPMPLKNSWEAPT